MDEKRGGRKGRTMVLDSIILPFSHLCFALFPSPITAEKLEI